MSASGSTITVGSNSNAYGTKYVQTTEPTSPCNGDIWYDTSSGSDTVPAGTVIYFAANSSPPPTGYIRANGASLSTTTYAALFAAIGYTFGGSGASFNAPDLRGEFIRGFDGSRGVDSGRIFGSAQGDAFKSHTHGIPDANQNAGFGANAFDTGGTAAIQNVQTVGITPAGDTETRPRNIALLAIIKY
jgi:microcystin-dependent protein